MLPPREVESTKRAHALAETLLDRHGVVVRGAVMSERVQGGFAAVYRVLAAFEESGRCRRGYFVDGLGAAQFAGPGAVDRLRAIAPAQDPGDFPKRRAPQTGSPSALVLAATDPANPFGAALPWPPRPHGGGHKPGRKAGALVVLLEGRLILYVERGGRSLLTWSEDSVDLEPAALALAASVRNGHLGRITVQTADGFSVLDSPLGATLEAGGFIATPRGLRLRA